MSSSKITREQRRENDDDAVSWSPTVNSESLTPLLFTTRPAARPEVVMEHVWNTVLTYQYAFPTSSPTQDTHTKKKLREIKDRKGGLTRHNKGRSPREDTLEGKEAANPRNVLVFIYTL